MERIFRVTDQNHCIFNAVEVPFISIDIITPAANCHKADIRVCLTQIKGKCTDFLFYAAGIQNAVCLKGTYGIDPFLIKASMISP